MEKFIERILNKMEDIFAETGKYVSDGNFFVEVAYEGEDLPSTAFDVCDGIKCTWWELSGNTVTILLEEVA